MMADGHWLGRVADVLRSDTNDLRVLASVAGFDPRTFYLGTSMDGTDLRGQDLSDLVFDLLDLTKVKVDARTRLSPDFSKFSKFRRRNADECHRLGQVALDSNDLPTAEHWFGLSASLRRVARDRPGLAQSYHSMGRLAQALGDLSRADEWYERSLAISTKLPSEVGNANRRSVGIATHQRGIVAQDRGDFDTAKRLYADSAELFQEIGDMAAWVISARQLARVAQDTGQLDEAEHWYDRIIETAVDLDDQGDVADTYFQLAALARARGDKAAERERLLRSLSARPSPGGEDALRKIYKRLKDLATEEGDTAAADSWDREVGNLPHRSGHS